MRRTSLIALATVSAVALTAAPAFAVTSKQSISAKVSPTKAGTSKKPANVSLNVRPQVALNPADGGFGTTKAVINLDKNVKLMGSKFKTCTAAQVQLGSCSSSAKVGSGTASGVALGLTEKLTVVAYNGPSGKSLLMRVKGSSPLVIDEVLIGKLAKGSGKYGTKMTVPIPGGLQQPAPGAFATLTDFNLTLKAGSSSKPFVALSGCPTGGLNVGGVFSYTDGTSQTVSTKAKCKKA